MKNKNNKENNKENDAMYQYRREHSSARDKTNFENDLSSLFFIGNKGYNYTFNLTQNEIKNTKIYNEWLEIINFKNRGKKFPQMTFKDQKSIAELFYYGVIAISNLDDEEFNKVLKHFRNKEIKDNLKLLRGKLNGRK